MMKTVLTVIAALTLCPWNYGQQDNTLTKTEAGEGREELNVPAASESSDHNTKAMNKYMQMAIEEAREGITNHHGGPFGSVIVKDGKVVAKGHNRVLKNNDPTCHGEVDAIRKACADLDTFDLTGCELYTTGEPCHMCLCACMWANISKIYYGCTIEDNAGIGFRDEKFSEIFSGRDKLRDYMQEMDRAACLELFREYSEMSHQNY